MNNLSSLKKIPMCFLPETDVLTWLFPTFMLFQAIFLWLMNTGLLLGEFIAFYRLVLNGDKPLNLEQSLITFSIAFLIESISIFISMRYEIRGNRLMRGMLLWPITIFLLPSLFTKWEENRKFNIVHDVMES